MTAIPMNVKLRARFMSRDARSQDRSTPSPVSTTESAFGLARSSRSQRCRFRTKVRRTMPRYRLLVAAMIPCFFVSASLSEAQMSTSPSGTIAYSDGNICLVNADGSGKRCLTRTGLNYGPVVWSADGRQLAFTAIARRPRTWRQA